MDKCICCDNNNFKTAFHWLDSEKKDISIKQCLGCGLMYQEPMQREEELNLLYDDDFFSTYEKYFLEFRKKQFQRDVRTINRFKPPSGKLLDVGCAFGIFLDEARKCGWDVFGIDVSKSAVEYARRKYGLNVFMGTLQNAQIAANSLDIVTAWDVIEHLAKPSDFLKEINRIMKKNGLLAIRTPNAQCLFLSINKFVNKFLGDNFAKVGPKFDHHKYLFSIDSLKNILRKTGFEVVYIGLELEDIIIVETPSFMNYMKAIVKKIIKILEFFNKNRRASILIYARKI